MIAPQTVQHVECRFVNVHGPSDGEKPNLGGRAARSPFDSRRPESHS